jgi:hypothetical protein
MPARLPRAVKLLRGTLRKDRDNPDAPNLEATEVPEPPDTLSEGEKAIWYELREAVEAIRVYDRSMYTSFRLLVKLVYSADQCPPGASSAGARIQQCAQQALATWGLRPSDRERVHAAPVAAPDSPDDEFTK